MAFKNMDNEAAVSPIVATLVLIVVAVVGAVAVGTIMGTFSNDVSSQANAGDVAGASATEILIAGSTTVQPVSELLAEGYMEGHSGVKVSVQGGGSGAGVASAGMGIVDIGAASRNMKSTETAKYTDLVAHPIGGSIVVAIVPTGTDVTALTTADDGAALVAVFNETDSSWTSVTREEESGTEDSFVDWCISVDGNFELAEDVECTGNQGVVDYVASKTSSDSVIGFCDYSYAKANSDSVDIVMINAEAEGDFEKDAKKLVSTYISSGNADATDCDQPSDIEYPIGLSRVLNYITGPNPSSIVNDYLTFATSPGAITYFEEAGYWAIVQL